MFSLLLTSHLISDFVFQPSSIIDLKKRSLLKGNLTHMVIIGFTQGLTILYFKLLIEINLLDLLLILVLVTVSHLIIDLLKSLLYNKLRKRPRMDFWVFVLDQVLHLTILYLISLTVQIDISNYNFTLYAISIYIFTLLVANYTIDKLWEIINEKNSKNNETKENETSEISGIIGIVERGIILTGMILGIYESIIVVVAIKSLIRLKDNKIKSDYYILGSLMSLLFVFIGFTLFKSLIELNDVSSILLEFLKLVEYK